MGAKVVNDGMPEAKLEAAIGAVVSKAFTWLGSKQVTHQTSFSFRLGRKDIKVDGAVEYFTAKARADVIIYHGELPIAVLELKKPGNDLTEDDKAQGLSYARMLTPPAPLVVVTNGGDVHFYETFSGTEWKSTSYSEVEFKRMMEHAARVAEGDLKLAVTTLMGNNPTIWKQAIRGATSDLIGELFGPWGETSRPFVADFLISREATEAILELVRGGAALTLLKGAPLSGKSNVLRELCQAVEQGEEKLAVLFVESGAGADVLQTLADAFTRALGWPINKAEARDWLMRLSRDPENRLVLALDGCDAFDTLAIREIEDLSSGAFGPSLSVVVAMDEASAEHIVLSSNGLSASPVGRRGQIVHLKELSDSEFPIAAAELGRHEMMFTHGAQIAPEFRQPWILRALCASALRNGTPVPTGTAIALPPLLSLDLVRHSRKKLVSSAELLRLFGRVADAVLEDTKDRKRDVRLMVESMGVNLVRHATAERHLSASDIAWLTRRGFLRPSAHPSGEAVLYVRTPELLASELARRLSLELIELIEKDPDSTSAWLEGAASSLPMGDVIISQSILDAADRSGRLPTELIDHLVDLPPQKTALQPGTRYAISYVDGEYAEVVIQADGTAILEREGRVLAHLLDDDLTCTYGNLSAWLALSHLAAFPLIIGSAEGEERVDPYLLLIVGSCGVPLRKPSGSSTMRALPTHDLGNGDSIVCHLAGIIEPITLSIFQFLRRSNSHERDEWLDAAIAEANLPLISRVHIVLLELTKFNDEAMAQWARNALGDKVLPEISPLLEVLHRG